MIEAKPVIPDRYWILREHNRKVGNIEAEPGGYSLNIRGRSAKFQTLDMIRDRVGVDFRSPLTGQPNPPGYEVNGYPTTHQPHNAIFDVQYQLPLWTREPRSKSWMAAGWYAVRQHRNWQAVLCPKRILLERYEFRGPFRTREEAMGI